MPAACVLVAILVGVPGCHSSGEDLFRGVTKIQIRTDYPEAARKTVTIVDKREIEDLVRAVQLREDRPCDCVHYMSVVFTTPGRVIEVSICEHCFDFDGKTYAMPPDFYRRVCEYLDSR